MNLDQRPVIRAQWAIEAEAEEGFGILDIIRRERSFNVQDATIAASFGINKKCFFAALGRLRKKGIDI